MIWTSLLILSAIPANCQRISHHCQNGIRIVCRNCNNQLNGITISCFTTNSNVRNLAYFYSSSYIARQVMQSLQCWIVAGTWLIYAGDEREVLISPVALVKSLRTTITIYQLDKNGVYSWILHIAFNQRLVHIHQVNE